MFGDRYQINTAERRGDEQFTLKSVEAGRQPSLFLNRSPRSVRAREVYASEGLRAQKFPLIG